jgi:tetratricopeptide (TPR) repeat protein/predicted Ser/Thr protein kinase
MGDGASEQGVEGKTTNRMNESLTPHISISHYRILSKLGEGGMGEVYLAEDTRLDRKVALKLLPSEFTKDPERLHRFEQEAKAASALNHPHIISIYEIGEAKVGRFIVMELVQGQTLRALNKPCDTELLINLGSQIARALSAAHAAGITHRDIKPDNIMVRDDGYVKIVDFGLARIAPLTSSGSTVKTIAHNTTPGSLIGTMTYMSPEQVRGEAVTPAADIFALGIVFYELATGEHPFDAESLIAILNSITSQSPVTALRLNPTIPAPLNTLIHSMLEKDARQRPSAGEVNDALARLAGISASSVFVSAPAAPAAALIKRNIVGRERERAELRAAFESAVAGRGKLLCVAGEPGLGKTTLVEEFLAEIAPVGQCTIARGRCSERLAGTEAYLPLLEALESLLQSGSNPSAARVMKQVAPTWYAQVVPMSSSTEGSERIPAEVKAASQERMKRELGAFFQEVARQCPLILFLDDLHWADVSTIDVLSFLAGKLDALNALIVVTYRPSDMLLAKHPFLQIKPDLQARGVCHELALEFLSLEEVESYLALEFPGNRFPRETAALIHAKTDGNPLFMADLTHYLRDRGVIAAESGCWDLAKPLPDLERELPESVRAMIQRKLEQLGEEDRRLLVGASVQGYEFDSTLVAKALDLDPADVEDQLESLDRVYALVRLVGEREFRGRLPSLRYRFVHVLYQNTLYASIRPTRRAQISAAVAEAMIALYGKHSADVASELAFLFEAARNWSSASEHYLIAAQNAAAVFANRESIELAERGLTVLRLLPDTSERAPQELKLQMTLGPSLMAGRGFAAPEVEQAFVRAAELSLQLDDRLDLFGASFSLAIVFLVKAEYADSTARAQQCLDLAGELRKPAMLMQSHWVMGLCECYLGHIEEARNRFEHTRVLHDAEAASSSTALYGDVLSRAHQARMELYMGYPDRSRGLILDAIERAKRLRHPIGLVNTFSLAAQIEMLEGNAQRTEELADAIARHSDEHGLPYYAATARMMSGWALAMRGQQDTGVESLREGLASYLATGTRQQHTYLLALLSEALDKAGRVSEALEALAEAIKVAAQSGERYFESELHRLRGELLLKSEAASPSEAEADFHKALSVSRDQNTKWFELRAAMSLARLWKQQGKPVEARETLAETYGWFTEGFGTADLQNAKALLEELQTPAKTSTG